MEKCCGQALPDVLWAQGLAWALGLRRTGCAARACLADRPSAFPEAARSAMLPSCTCSRCAEGLKGRVSGLWSHAASESDLGFPGAATGSDYSRPVSFPCATPLEPSGKGLLVSTWCLPRGQIPGFAFWPRKLTLAALGLWVAS